MPEPARQSRLDAFRHPAGQPAAAPRHEASTDPTPREPEEGAGSGRPAQHRPIPPVTERDRRRIHVAALEGLAAAGFEDPLLTLVLKPHSSLRASLWQDRAGRIRPGEPLTVELTDGYVLAPERAVAGLVASLGLSVLRRRRQGDMARLLIEYHDLWQRSRAGRELQSRVRRQRARKQGQGPRGAAHDLEAIRRRLAYRFFAGRIDDVALTWSSREGYNVLGHHDGDLDTIVVNRCLDRAEVPESVVAYVLYHELLHHTLGIQEVPGGRRSLHPPSFRRREQRFPHWELADEYLEAMCSKRGPIAPKRAPKRWQVLWEGPWDVPAAASTLQQPAALARRAGRKKTGDGA